MAALEKLMLLTPISRARLRAIGTTLVGALALAACATPTPYQPATGSGFYRNGYADQQIEPNRYQVSFAGNSLTSRETVERYLLYRSAQLTLERGYDYFILADRDTNLRSRTYSTPGVGGFGGWGAGFGWGGMALSQPGVRLAHLGSVLGRSVLRPLGRYPHRRQI